jgi:hypothetical protein
MDVAGLLEPILTGGIKNTNFFNGRIVTAEDLRTEQAAKKRQLAQLATAVGDGVVWGFEVTLAAGTQSDPPGVRIKPGLALNRNGEAVALPVETVVRFGPATPQAAETGLFQQCEPPSLQFQNFGMYVLTVKPASGLQGRAPMTELGMEGVGTTCGSRYAVEGVRFGAVPFTVPAGTDASPLAKETAQLIAESETQLAVLARLTGAAAGPVAPEVIKKLSRVRSAVAYLCFGVERFTELAADPLPRADGTIPFAEYGLLDALRKDQWLTDCEVPLALLYWSVRGMEFIDWWSVRRPVFPEPVSPEWATVAGRRWAVEGLAMVLQFQQHIEDLARTSGATLRTIEATEYFRFLPPVGFLPLLGAVGNSGVAPAIFFATRKVRDSVFLEGAKLARLVSTALLYPPTNLARRANRSEEELLLWQYRVRENTLSVAPQSGTGRPFLMFTNAHVPVAGYGQYDLAYWNYASYA